MRRSIERSLAATALVLGLVALAACGSPAKRDATPTATGDVQTSGVDRTATAAAEASATATDVADNADGTEPPATLTALETSTPAPCAGPCPVVTTPSSTPAPITAIPKVPPLRALRFSSNPTLTEPDLALRGQGPPGRGAFTGARLVIGKIGADATFETATVAADGSMPNPTNPRVVAWYDFGAWPDLGGLPLAGGNVVLGGDLRQGATEGVFIHADQLAPGDVIQLYLDDGRRLFYVVEFNKTAPVASLDMTEVVRSTADESLTLVTAAGAPLPPGQGKPGTYSDRRIIWARRLNCTLLESPETPTMNPYLDCEEPT